LSELEEDEITVMEEGIFVLRYKLLHPIITIGKDVDINFNPSRRKQK
jgi:hypothetical protein